MSDPSIHNNTCRVPKGHRLTFSPRGPELAFETVSKLPVTGHRSLTISPEKAKGRVHE